MNIKVDVNLFFMYPFFVWVQMRSFRTKYVLLHKHYATVIKLLEEELSEKVPSKVIENDIIKVNHLGRIHTGHVE